MARPFLAGVFFATREGFFITFFEDFFAAVSFGICLPQNGHFILNVPLFREFTTTECGYRSIREAWICLTALTLDSGGILTPTTSFSASAVQSS